MSLFDITILSLTEIFGDFKLKDYARHNKPIDLAQGLIGYGGVIFFLITALRRGNVMYVNSMWDGVSGILGTCAAYIILGERLKNAAQYFGLILILIGTIILHSGGIPSY